ncbi:hypothetical protein [Bradyrhizobium tunisiense]|uniref:hypothetical protein n=1 Tax=Bradyrhizobium tunisiense TaxID=3278709 RepID=UPI0035DFA4A0
MSWRRYIAFGAASLTFGLFLAVAILAVLDPFGRLRLSEGDQFGFIEERPVMVSRAVAPQFNSAIIGNSSSMPLMPESLSTSTGQRFVSLSISGTAAPASIATMTFFLAQHPDAKIIVAALLPETWCGADFQEHRPFPYWLYSSVSHYLVGLAGETSFKQFATIFSNRQSMKADGYRPWIATDGYHPFTGPFVHHDIDTVRAILSGNARPEKSSNSTGRFPAIERLAEAIGRSSPAFFVLVWTPRYVTYIPRPGSDADKTDRECKSTLVQSTSDLRHVKVLDWSSEDRPENHNAAHFFDAIHYRRAYAALIEDSIGLAIPTELKGP